MYPPKSTANIAECLQNMFESLIRAGLEINWNIDLDEKEDGTSDVRVRLISPVPKEGWKPFREYMSQYALVSGWKIEKLRQSRGLLAFSASRA